jgi:methylglyoxal reductase
MEYREIGRSGLRASVIGLGTWAVGGGPWWGTSDDAESVRAIHAAMDCGINLIDTAPAYGWGHSEDIVGRAIQGRRDQVILATKCGLHWDHSHGAAFFESEGYTVRRCLEPKCVREELEASLKRLRTDRIDLYQTHWQAVEPLKTPIAETMSALMDLRRAGKILAIGVCNVTIADMDAYRAAGQIESNQARYSMLDRRLESGITADCIRHGVSILAYTPLEQGLLTGRITMGTAIQAGEYRNNLPWIRPANRRRVLDMLAGWNDLCRRHACTLSQLVIAWTVLQPGITHALCGARKSTHVQENAQAGSIKLTPADSARMRRDVEALGRAE